MKKRSDAHCRVILHGCEWLITRICRCCGMVHLERVVPNNLQICIYAFDRPQVMEVPQAVKLAIEVEDLAKWDAYQRQATHGK